VFPELGKDVLASGTKSFLAKVVLDVEAATLGTRLARWVEFEDGAGYFVVLEEKCEGEATGTT